ncbi:MAG TPA: hypothetical protein DIC64_03530, partial [Alphaproteobacteria bacterium]|nr:hypothetical protein [Alphaproteobacteria bacterium]
MDFFWRKKLKDPHLRGRLENGEPNPVDVYVGTRIKVRRNVLALSQQDLADALGLTFQQIQKYEKGLNRIGASRLWDIAQILKVPMDFFFSDMPLEVQIESPRAQKGKTVSLVMPSSDPMQSFEALELVHSYFNLKKYYPKAAEHLRLAFSEFVKYPYT